MELPSWFYAAMEKAMGVVLPDPHGACALLRKLSEELLMLKHLQATDSQLFPGSALDFTPPQRCTWMARIWEDRPIGQIVWPATHKSATDKIGLNLITRPFGQHQTLSIYYQLGNGVRALDIRVQQDKLVCNGNFLSYSIHRVIQDIKKFLQEYVHEIIILEIRTENGYTDPPDFETYLVEQLGDLLIHQNDRVFSKTISQVLPGRIICIWKPNNSPRPSAGGPIWSATYLRDDKFATELPHTKFQANLLNLRQQTPASERNYFYKVEHILTPQASNALEWMLVWPRLANVVSKRINDFARLFLAKCHSENILDRLQIFSTDFINDEFIIACIALNHSMAIKENCLESKETTEPSSRENMKQWDNEEVRSKCLEMELKSVVDEKAQMDARVTSILKDKESLTRRMEDATGKLEMMEKHSQDLELNYKKEQAVLKEKNRSLEMKLKSAEKDKEHLESMQKHRQELEQKVKNLEVQLEKTKLDSTEKNRAAQIQCDLDELKNKYEERCQELEAISSKEAMLTEELDGARDLLAITKKRNQELELISEVKVSDNENVFMVFPKDLSLEDYSGWKWSYLTETSSNAVVEVLELVQVSWLKVGGKFETETLTKGVKYEVAFVVMLKNSDSEWENPVSLLLVLPDGTTQRNQESLSHKPREKWIEIPVGSFMVMPSNINRNIKFTLEGRGKELKKGVVIKGVVIRKKYKVEIVFPRDLVISSYENPQCWRWASLYERDEAVEVAELLKVNRLEVSGKFGISSLLPGHTYEVVYIIMLKDSSYEWKAPVSLSLVYPNGQKVERQETLAKSPREEWITILVGTFKKTGRKSGFVEFSLYNFEDTPKSGLLIKSVVIQQKILKTSASNSNCHDVVV